MPVEYIVQPTTVYINSYVERAISIDLVVGNTYTVVWDGVEYECVCYSHFGDPVIGNNACWEGSDGNGEPFLVSNYNNLTAINVYQAGTYTIAILDGAEKEIIHKLDSKYLDIPKNIATTDDLENLAETVSEQIDAAFNGEKDYLILKDAISGIQYKIQVKNGDLTSTVIASLDDFDYITNDDGTYTITGWKETYLGNDSNIMVFPDDERVII